MKKLIKKHYYGYKPDLKDVRDFKFSLEPLETLPKKVDMRPLCTPVYDQGQLGSCTANAISACYDFVLKKNGLPTITPSRLFIYYNERAAEDSVAYDSGAQIRDGMKTIAAQGVCPESDWPYIPNAFAVLPAASCYQSALTHRSIRYESLPNSLLHLRTCLSQGYPFVFGFTVYESFESDQVALTGKMPVPKPTEEVLGGHAVMCVGYDDTTQMFIVRNSWGDTWGQEGYFGMPYTCMTNLASDFWAILEDE